MKRADSSTEPPTVDETAEAFGHLSVDQNKEVRMVIFMRYSEMPRWVDCE